MTKNKAQKLLHEFENAVYHLSILERSYKVLHKDLVRANAFVEEKKKELIELMRGETR